MEDFEIYVKAKKIAQQLRDILQHYTPDDHFILREWLEANREASQLLEELTDEEQFTQKLTEYQKCNSQEAQKLLHQLIRKRQRQQLFSRWSKIAAIVIVIITTAIFLKYTIFPPIEATVQTATTGISSPTLITADGKNINLSGISADSVIRISNKQILYNKNKALKYSHEDKVSPSAGLTGLNQLIIPSQCDYQVILSDNSIVHLNAESRLEYPSQFSTTERRVRLIGEGYFEIQHDGRPFIVEVNQIKIRVYGTKFNINAYDPQYIETVLAEGSIGIVNLKDTSKEQLLKPNQLCITNLTTKQQIIQNVDIEKYISWTTGYLKYDGDPLERVTKDLGRWYGKEFIFASHDLAAICISASINKDTPLPEVLNMIQSTTKTKFRQIERRYIISR